MLLLRTYVVYNRNLVPTFRNLVPTFRNLVPTFVETLPAHTQKNKVGTGFRPGRPGRPGRKPRNFEKECYGKLMNTFS